MVFLLLFLISDNRIEGLQKEMKLFVGESLIKPVISERMEIQEYKPFKYVKRRG